MYYTLIGHPGLASMATGLLHYTYTYSTSQKSLHAYECYQRAYAQVLGNFARVRAIPRSIVRDAARVIARACV